MDMMFTRDVVKVTTTSQGEEDFSSVIVEYCYLLTLVVSLQPKCPIWKHVLDGGLMLLLFSFFLRADITNNIE